MEKLPIIDMSPLLGGTRQASAHVARAIDEACRDSGFFYVTGHGVDPQILSRLEAASWRFFSLPENVKLEIAMASGRDDGAARWDKADVHAFQGAYGAYLMGKVSRVFPDPGRDIL